MVCLWSVSLVCLQVFPHVLHVCESGLCCSDSAQNAQLETAIQVLPLVSFRAHVLPFTVALLNLCLPLFQQDSILPWHEPLSLAHVHLFLVLCHHCHGNRQLYLQVYRVPRVSGLWPGVGGETKRWIRIWPVRILRSLVIRLAENSWNLLQDLISLVPFLWKHFQSQGEQWPESVAGN